MTMCCIIPVDSQQTMNFNETVSNQLVLVLGKRCCLKKHRNKIRVYLAVSRIYLQGIKVFKLVVIQFYRRLL